MRAPSVTETGLVAVAVIGVLTLTRIGEIDSQFHSILSSIRSNQVSTVTSSWLSGGITRSVTTTRGSDETVDAYAARHQAEVNAFLLIYPKDD